MELNLPQARILIIKMSSLGDIICALPALFALRKKYPHAHITWAVHHAFKDILPGTPYLDDKVVIDRNRLRQPSYWRELHRELRERSFDLVLDLQMLAKSALVARLSGAKARYGYWEAREGSGLVSQPIVGAHQYGHITERLLDVVEYFGADIDRIAYPLCDISDAEVTLRQKLQALGVTGEYIVIAPSSRGAGKDWPETSWRELIGQMTADGRHVVIAGSAADTPLAQRLLAGDRTKRTADLTGQTSLRELLALEKHARMHISGDTGPLHIANAYGTSIIGLYGPTRPERSGPFHNPQGDYVTAQQAQNADLKIKKNRNIAMSTILVEDVITLYRKKINAEQKKRP